MTAMSVCAACALLASPAFADDGKGRSSGNGRGGDDHARAATTTAAPAQPAQPRDDRGRGDDRNRPAANPIPQVVHAEHEAEHEVEHVAAPPVLNLVVDNRGPGNAFGHDEDNRGPGNARDRDNDNVANVSTVNDLVNAINNQVGVLTNASPRLEIENEDELNEANEVAHLRVISLGTLTAGLSAADATAVTNAVNANTSALQSFLGSGGANANAIDAALNAIGVAPSSALTILSDGEHLLVVTA